MSNASDTAIKSSNRLSKPKVPEAKTTENRKRKNVPSMLSAIQQFAEQFPSRAKTPKELHAMTNICLGTCVHCSAQYIIDDKKEARRFVLKKI